MLVAPGNNNGYLVLRLFVGTQKTTLEHQIDALEDERDETVLARNRERRRSRRERGAPSTAVKGDASPSSASVIVSVAILDAKIADLQNRIEGMRARRARVCFKPANCGAL